MPHSHESPHLDLLFPRRMPGSNLKESLPKSVGYINRRPTWHEHLVIERMTWCIIRAQIYRTMKSFSEFKRMMEEQAQQVRLMPNKDG